MDAETWMDANKAIELGFADEILTRSDNDADEHPSDSVMFSRKAVDNALMNKVAAKYEKPKAPVAQQAEIPVQDVATGRTVAEINERLSLIKQFI